MCASRELESVLRSLRLFPRCGDKEKKSDEESLAHLIAHAIYCGEGGIRTRETLLAFTHFPGVPLQPLEHLSLSACLRLLLDWKAPQRYNNICILPNCHALGPRLGHLWQTLWGGATHLCGRCKVNHYWSVIQTSSGRRANL